MRMTQCKVRKTKNLTQIDGLNTNKQSKYTICSNLRYRYLHRGTFTGTSSNKFERIFIAHPVSLKESDTITFANGHVFAFAMQGCKGQGCLQNHDLKSFWLSTVPKVLCAPSCIEETVQCCLPHSPKIGTTAVTSTKRISIFWLKISNGFLAF